MQSEAGSPRRAAASPTDASKQEISDIRRELKKIMADPVILNSLCVVQLMDSFHSALCCILFE